MATNEKLLSSLFDLSRFVRKEVFMDECLGDISHSEAEVMLFLKDVKKTTMKAIADHLRIKPSSVTPIVEGLSKKRMLQRKIDKKDRRVIYIEMTKTGVKKMIHEQRKIHKKLNKIFQKLSERNKQELIKIFNILLKNYE